MQLAYPVALVFGTREYVYEAFLIPTRSMSPNFLAGDRILVNKVSYRLHDIHRGDIVVFSPPPAARQASMAFRIASVLSTRSPAPQAQVLAPNSRTTGR